MDADNISIGFAETWVRIPKITATPKYDQSHFFLNIDRSKLFEFEFVICPALTRNRFFDFAGTY
ncbi:hypothetical protein AGMMS50276_26520 [Synergistales bacterium]|nr:hypothetical protein AGMMS50276_26520 [Synergistales bacterium]